MSEIIASQIMLEKKYVDTGIGRIGYFCGPRFPGRPTAVLLHGLSANHTTWRPLMQRLSELRINAIAPDLRGHGCSDKVRRRSLYRLPRMKDDVMAIIQNEKIERAHFVGYSWGGWIALDLAGTHPDAAQTLSVISTNYLNPFAYSRIWFVAPIVRFLINLGGWLMLWQSRRDYFYFDQDKDAGYWKSTYTGLFTMPVSINFWMLSEVMKIDYSDILPRISAPTLILYGKDDAYVSEREMNDMGRRIPNATVRHLVGSGHFLASRSQKEVADEIVAFLEHHI